MDLPQMEAIAADLQAKTTATAQKVTDLDTLITDLQGRTTTLEEQVGLGFAPINNYYINPAGETITLEQALSEALIADGITAAEAATIIKESKTAVFYPKLGPWEPFAVLKNMTAGAEGGGFSLQWRQVEYGPGLTIVEVRGEVTIEGPPWETGVAEFGEPEMTPIHALYFPVAYPYASSLYAVLGAAPGWLEIRNGSAVQNEARVAFSYAVR